MKRIYEISTVSRENWIDGLPRDIYEVIMSPETDLVHER